MPASNNRIARVTSFALTSGSIERALVQVLHDADYHLAANDLTPQPCDLPCAHYL